MEEISADFVRNHFDQITLPEGLFQLAPGRSIPDLAIHIEAQIQRLDSASPILRRLAYQALQLLAEKLGHPLPEG